MTALSLLRKTFVLWLGLGAARVLGAGILVVLARVLGVGRYGIFGYAMSLALLLEVVIDMGQSVHIGRIISREPDGSASVFTDVLANKLVVGTFATVGAWAVLRLTGTSAEEALTVAFMVVWATFLSILDTERAVSRALGMFGSDSLVNGGESVGRLLAVAGAWALGFGLVGFGAAFAIECGVAAVVFAVVLDRRTSLLSRLPSAKRALAFLREAIPLGLAGVAFVGFYQIDQVFVRTLAGPEANGVYGAATRVVFAANSLGGLVAIAAYPELSRLHRDAEAFRRRFAATVGLATATGLAMSVVTFLLAEPIVRLLYGAAYAGSVPLLRILAPIVVLDALAVCAIYTANALGREKRVFVVIAALFAANGLANWLLVPRYGAFAAAWISTAGEALLAGGVLAVSWDRMLAAPRIIEPEAKAS